MPDSKDFLKALWQGIENGHAYARLIKTNGSGDSISFRWPEEIDALDSWVQEETGYLGFGIHNEASGSRSSIKAVTTFWNTINLAIVPFERAVEALKRFPARPSAGIEVKGILHIFWFLKEVLSVNDFDLVWAANRTIPSRLLLGTNLDDTHTDPILQKMGLQASHCDFDGLFRAPGQPGSRFVSWHPEVRYTVDEFADLVNPPRPTVSPAPAAPATAQAPATPVDLEIPDEDRDKIIQAMGENWYEEGKMTLHLAGMLAHAGIAHQVTKSIVVGACKKGGGDHERASKTVDDTYQRKAKGENLTGAPSLIKAFDPLPEHTRERFKKALEKIKKLIPKPPADGNYENPGPEPDFNIQPPIIKFDSRPARWSVTLIVDDGRDLEATCETTNFIAFNLFQAAFYEQTHYMLKDITQFRWKRMIADSPIEVKSTPPEARPEGAIEAALEEFLGEAREEPDVGVLRSFPGYDEKNTYFRFNAFKVFMKDVGERLDNRMIFDTLKRLNFETKTKRIGTRTYKVWMREMGGGNGSPAPKPQISEKTKENDPELFPDNS